jgi:hypothetical protein
MLHAAILFATFQLYERSQPFEWPKQPSVTGGYLVKLDELPTPKPESTKKPTVSVTPPGAAAPMVERPKIPPRHPFVRPSGTKVDRPTVKIAVAVPDQTETGVPKIPSTKIEPPKVGLFMHEEILLGIAARNVGQAAQQGGPEGKGGPAGQGGPGKGPPGVGGLGLTVGGKKKGNGPVGDIVKTDGPMNTGVDRDAICMGAGCGDGPGPEYLPPPEPPPPDQPTLTAKEIDQVIRRSQGLFRTCYQKELNRNSTLSGDIRIHFQILPNGRVTGQRKNGGSMTNGEVIQCVKNSLGYLRFPQKGGALVNYPFVFNPGQ